MADRRKRGTEKYWQERKAEQNIKQIIEKEKNDKKGYDKFIKNTKIKSKTTKHKTIPKWMCPVCQKHKVQSKHHIIPRKYNGSNDKTNLIWLCNSCHDIIEMKTEEWIESGKRYNSDILRSMIINNGF